MSTSEDNLPHGPVSTAVPRRRVFISHASADKPFARRLADSLGAHGFEPWLDENEIMTGRDFLRSIEEGLASSRFVVLILSPHAVKSGRVGEEWRAAFAHEVRTQAHILLPVLLAPCDVPYLLDRRQRAEFTGTYDSTNMFTAPEVIPGLTKSDRDIELLFFDDYCIAVKHVLSQRKWLDLPRLAGIGVLVFVPPLFYRWSLKATAPLYAPLLWIAWATRRVGLSYRDRLELIKGSPASAVVVVYSLLVLALLTAKCVLYATWDGFAHVGASSPAGRLLAVLIRPAEFPPWHLAMLANAVSALALCFLARYALVRIAIGNPLPPSAVERSIRVTTFVRCVLTIYVIVCTVYLVVNTAGGLSMPPLGDKPLPWS